MKKLFLIIILGFSAVTSTFAQAVADNAVIPISVTLNSIFRLTIRSGGNIEFVVNTIQQYTDGIANTTLYDTRFNVASSIDFDVTLGAEATTLINTGSPTAAPSTMLIDNIGFKVIKNGTGAFGTNWTTSVSAVKKLKQIASTGCDIIESIAGFGAGDVAKNDFTINWELATATVIGLTAGLKPMLGQNLQAGRYSVNVFLAIKAADAGNSY